MSIIMLASRLHDSIIQEMSVFCAASHSGQRSVRTMGKKTTLRLRDTSRKEQHGQGNASTLPHASTLTHGSRGQLSLAVMFMACDGHGLHGA